MLEHSDNTESLTSRLVRAQEAHTPTPSFFETRVRYRLYTENMDNLIVLVSRYFFGATIIPSIGVWKGETELSTVIEILGAHTDLQRIMDLAGDIRVTNKQDAVYVTRELVHFREVNASV